MKKSEFLRLKRDEVREKMAKNQNESLRIGDMLLNCEGDCTELQEQYNRCFERQSYLSALVITIGNMIDEAEELERKEAREYHRDEWESGEEYEENTQDYEEE